MLFFHFQKNYNFFYNLVHFYKITYFLSEFCSLFFFNYILQHGWRRTGWKSNLKVEVTSLDWTQTGVHLVWYLKRTFLHLQRNSNATIALFLLIIKVRLHSHKTQLHKFKTKPPKEIKKKKKRDSQEQAAQCKNAAKKSRQANS